MSWLRRKSKADPPPPDDRDEARQALSKMDKTIKETKEADEEINAVTIKLIEYGKRNNFTALVVKSLQPRRGS